MRHLPRIILRFVAIWIIEALSLLAMAVIIPGIRLIDTPSTRAIDVAMAAALVLFIFNVLVRPILLRLTLPVNALTLGFSTLFINAVMLGLTAYMLPGFEIDGLGPALLGAIALAAANVVLTIPINVDDNSFFESLVEGLGRRQRQSAPGVDEPGRGLVMLEIDGLSYARMQRAAEQGLMPTVQAMRNSTHRLSRFDCGLPSQTSACQAGILYGDNDNIPAFRWFDKARGRMIVSNNFHDAAEINARYARGRGLLRGGSSVNNLLSGDATKTLLTMSNLTDRAGDAVRSREEDLYLYFLNPYHFTRSLVLTVWDILVELFQGARQRIRNVRPRVNRLHNGYPILRAITNVFLRDLATYMIALDVIRGVPVMYTTYVGYDEVAHYAGPDTSDAMNTLRGLDKQIRRIRDIIAHKAPRPYDLFILSDHGQSVGEPFRQRYGLTLTELISRLTSQETRVVEVLAGMAGASYTAALVAELERVEREGTAGRIGRATLKGTRRSLGRPPIQYPGPQAEVDAEVTVCASGNLAHVYFRSEVGKIGLSDLNTTHPGLVDALVAHPGIGFVVARNAEDSPIVLGKTGARDLVTGAVTGSDPLLSYGDPDLRARQLLRVAQFEQAGDLIVNSAMYTGGQVASFEEMVGSHGGLGGDQTEPFVLHPADMLIPRVINSVEIFALLDARRGLPVEAPQPMPAPPEVDAWAPKTLWAGLRDWHAWWPRALRALRVERQAFVEVARDPYATGPALLIVAVTFSIQIAVDALNPGPIDLPVRQPLAGILVWMLLAAAAHWTGRLLGGTGQFTATFRAVSFALMPQVFSLLGLIPVVGPLLDVAAGAVAVFGVWVALQAALALRRRMALLLPFGLALLIAIAFVVPGLLAGGLSITIEAILSQLGVTRLP